MKKILLIIIIGLFGVKVKAQEKVLNIIDLEKKVSENLKSGKSAYENIERKVEFNLQPKANSKKEMETAEKKLKENPNVFKTQYDKSKNAFTVWINTKSITVNEIKNGLNEANIEYYSFTEIYYTTK